MDTRARNKQLLYEIVMKNDVKKLEEILKDKDSTMSVNQTIKGDSTTALHLAIANDQAGMVVSLLKNGANKYYRSNNGNTCLHLATRTGNVGLILLFLQYIDVNDWNVAQQAPLHIAVAHEHAEAAEILLKNRADVDLRDSDGNTPLHLAIRNRSVPLIALLLKHGANPNLRNADGNSSFHKLFQLRELDDDLLQLFLSKGANAHLKDDSGRNALHLAATYATFKLVYRLLSNSSRSIDEPTKLYRMTALHLVLLYSAREDEVVSNIACFLVIRGANVNALDENDRSPLFNAVSSRRAKAARYLLSAGANVNGFGKRVPVLEAVRKCDLPMLRCLLDSGARVDAKNEHEEGALLYALGCVKDEALRYDMAKLLLDRGSSVKQRDARGSTALHRAIDEHDLRLFSLLIERGAPIDATNHSRESPLFAAVSANFYEAARILISMGCKVADCCQNLLLLAVSRGNKKMMSLLLSNGASTGHDGGALVLAAADESVAKMKLLVANGAIVETDSLAGHLVLVKAIRARRSAMVEYFLENGASVNFEHQAKVALSHAFDVFDREHKSSEKTIDLLVKYTALLSSLNLYVHPANVVLIKSKQWSYERYNVYLRELAEMKEARICADYATTYFDVLVKRRNALVQCLRCRRIKTTLLKGHFEQLFKNYSYELRVNYLRGLGRMQTIDELRKVLNEIFASVLPYDVIGKISEYYNDDDFVACLRK